MIKRISWFLSNWRGIKVAYGAVGVFAIGARIRCYRCNEIPYHADFIYFSVRYTSVCFEQKMVLQVGWVLHAAAVFGSNCMAPRLDTRLTDATVQ